MDIEITSLLGVLVVIAGTIGGVYIKALLGKVKTEKIDAISKYAWTAVRSSEDQISADSKGVEKFNIAMKIMKKHVNDKEEILEDYIMAAYQNFKNP